MWVVTRENLTEDQLAAIQLSPDKNRVIFGGPGSGKTLVLAHRARQLILDGTPSNRIRLLVYTNVLRDYVEEGLIDMGLVNRAGSELEETPDNCRERTKFFALTPDDDPQALLDVVAIIYSEDGNNPESAFVRKSSEWKRSDELLERVKSSTPPWLHELNIAELRKVVRQFERGFSLGEQAKVFGSAELVQTFDSWCIDLFDTLVGGKRPWNAEKKMMDFEKIRLEVLEIFESNKCEKLFDALLVDEGQDLTPTSIKLMKAVSTHVTLAMDGRQQLYSNGIDPQEALDILEVRRAAASLLNAYRCTPLVVDLAAEFLPSQSEAIAFRTSNLLSVDDIETPVLFRAKDRNEELDQLAIALGDRAMLGHNTAVLVPTQRAASDVLKEMEKRGLNCSHRKDLSFGDLRPIILTYHSAKGLTVDSIFLPTLTEKAFRGFTDSEQRTRMLFVGITRATKWAWLGTHEGDQLELLSGIEALEKRKSLRILPRTSTLLSAAVIVKEETPTTSIGLAGLL